MTVFQRKLKVEMNEEYGSVIEFMFNAKDLFFYCIMHFTVKLSLDPRHLILFHGLQIRTPCLASVSSSYFTTAFTFFCYNFSILMVSKAWLSCYEDLQATVSQEQLWREKLHKLTRKTWQLRHLSHSFSFVLLLYDCI